MAQILNSPRITHLAWGCLEVEGYTDAFKDAKLYPGGARAWDWNETGTNHEAGIQPADVQELVDKGAKSIVLSKGMSERLQVCPETIKMLKDRDISVHTRKTDEAVQLYNELREKEPVGGLFHTTC